MGHPFLRKDFEIWATRPAGNGYTYDAAGNMTNDGFHTYTYDAEGNILKVNGGNTASYVYDALNRRVRVVTPSVTHEYLYDYAGRRISSWRLNVQGYPAGLGGPYLMSNRCGCPMSRF